MDKINNTPAEGIPSAEEKSNQTPAQIEKTNAERFTDMVIKEFQSQAGTVELSDYQRRLCQRYFIKIDQVLAAAEMKRLAKAEQFRDNVSITWNNVNRTQLAVDVVAYANVGLDPTQPNHINLIPYKNNSTNKYDIGFIIGYKGAEIKALKYGLEIPSNVIVELVYSTDEFKAIKKDMNNPIEGYSFKITNDFERGELKGGFYYLEFKDSPEKNKLKVFTKADIDKRKPSKASVEFWGGEKDKWEKNEQGRNVKVGTEKVDGWYEEMAYKTIHRAAYNSITIDAKKIDDSYLSILQKERDQAAIKVEAEIELNANKTEMGFEESSDAVDIEHEEVFNQSPTSEYVSQEQPSNLFNNSTGSTIAKPGF